MLSSANPSSKGGEKREDRTGRRGEEHQRRISGPQRDKQKLHGNKETGAVLVWVHSPTSCTMSGCDGGGFPALTAAEPASRAAGRGMGSEEESGGVVCSDAEVQSGYMMEGGGG